MQVLYNQGLTSYEVLEKGLTVPRSKWTYLRCQVSVSFTSVIVSVELQVVLQQKEGEKLCWDQVVMEDDEEWDDYNFPNKSKFPGVYLYRVISWW